MRADDKLTAFSELERQTRAESSAASPSPHTELPNPRSLSPQAEARRQLGIAQTKQVSDEEYRRRVNNPTACDRCGLQHETVESRTHIQVGLETGRLQYKFCDWCAKEVAEQLQRENAPVSGTWRQPSRFRSRRARTYKIDPPEAISSTTCLRTARALTSGAFLPA